MITFKLSAGALPASGTHISFLIHFFNYLVIGYKLCHSGGNIGFKSQKQSARRRETKGTTRHGKQVGQSNL